MIYFCTNFSSTVHQPDLSSLDSFDLHIVPCFDWIEAATVFPFAAGTSFLGSQKKKTDWFGGRTHLILCITLKVLLISFNSIQVRCFVVKTMFGNLIQKLHQDQHLWVFVGGDSFGARHGTSKGLSLVTSTPETTYSEHTAKKSEILHQLGLVVFYPISQVVIGFWFTITSYHLAKSRFPYLAAAATSALGDAKRLASWAAFVGGPFPFFWDIWAVSRTACWLAVETWIGGFHKRKTKFSLKDSRTAANTRSCTVHTTYRHFLVISLGHDFAMLHMVTTRRWTKKTSPQTVPAQRLPVLSRGLTVWKR